MRKLLTIVLSAALLLSAGAYATRAFAAEEPSEPAETKSQTVKFGDLQNDTHDAEFGLKEGVLADYGVKTGKVSAPVDFDTHADKKLTYSNDAEVACENWRWTTNCKNNIIVVFEFKCDAAVSVSMSEGEVNGWVADTKISVYKKSGEAAAESVKETAVDGNDSLAYGGEVKSGDTLYYVWSVNDGVTGTRNIQNIHTLSAVISKVEQGGEYLTAEEYQAELQKYAGTLEESAYSAENWKKIEDYISGFIAAAGDKTGALLKAEYENTLEKIKAVLTIEGELKACINDAIAAFDAKIALAKEEDFTAENYASVTAMKKEFETAVKACTDEEKVAEKYDEFIKKLSEVRAIRTSATFLDMVPDTYEADYGMTKQFGIFEYGIKYGKVLGEIKDFDAYKTDSSSDRLYSSELGENDVVAHNWQWVATKQNSVIAVFKALADCRMDIVCTRMEDGGAVGWTVNTNLTVYICRNGGNKAVYSANNPASDEAFGGTFYAKAGDIIYYEFNTDHMSQTVNIQTPFSTVITVDSTGFNQEKYDDQNDDLSEEVVAALSEKKAALDTFVSGLKEADYSATNWSLLQAIPEEFMKAAENEIDRKSTVADVEALYRKYLEEAEAVETLAEAEASFQAAKQTKKDEIRAYADEMLKKNKYSKENKQKIEEYVSDAHAEIDAATNNKGINDAVTKAKNLINKLETKSGCGGCGGAFSISSAFVFLAAAGAAVVLKRKAEKR